MPQAPKFSRKFKRLSPINYQFGAAFLFNSLENTAPHPIVPYPQCFVDIDSERHKQSCYSNKNSLQILTTYQL